MEIRNLLILIMTALIGTTCSSDAPSSPTDMGPVDMVADQPPEDMPPDQPSEDMAPDLADMALPDQPSDMPVELCGNGIIDPGEECDGEAFGTQSCITEGFTSGELVCTSTCEISAARCDLCGDGTCGMSETASGCPTECAAVAVSAADSHTCAVRADGSVWCWGARDGHRAGGMGDVEIPHPLAGITGATSVATGESHTCVIAAGAVYCWGLNEFAQLGAGPPSREKGSPQAVTLPANAIHLSAGRHHTCATLEDRTLHCWGRADHGQVGPDFGRRWVAPRNMGITNVNYSAAGEHHTCSDGGGGVRCWGWNEQGQLGAFDRRWRAEPIVSANLGRSVGVGARHTCANIVNLAAPPQFSGLYCWGSNGYGQLGAAPANDYLAAVKVIAPAIAISGGATFTCGMSTAPSIVTCWGRNDFGQLGDGTVTPRFNPELVSGFDNAVEIKAGTDHACARLDDGQLRCWGRNQHGQIGTGTQAFYATPTAPEGFQ